MAHSLTPEAQSDLADIWLYVATESGIGRADRLIDALAKRFYLLSTHSRLGRERDDLRDGLRSFPVGNHTILYRITAAGDVVILHVPSGRQDLHNVLGS